MGASSSSGRGNGSGSLEEEVGPSDPRPVAAWHGSCCCLLMYRPAALTAAHSSHRAVLVNHSRASRSLMPKTVLEYRHAIFQSSASHVRSSCPAERRRTRYDITIPHILGLAHSGRPVVDEPQPSTRRTSAPTSPPPCEYSTSPSITLLSGIESLCWILQKALLHLITRQQRVTGRASPLETRLQSLRLTTRRAQKQRTCACLGSRKPYM